jgi:hypothetical protein
LSRRDQDELHVRRPDSLRDWFRRVIGTQQVEIRIRECSLEANFAFFGNVVWRDATILQCSFQALITESPDLLTFYRDDNHAAQYYRLDFDPTRPGPLFAEPQPHIHCIPHGPPRFPLACDAREYCLISFLEFIYRNHFHAKWLTWVKSVSNEGITPTELDAIIAAFDTGTVEARITELGPLLKTLKATLSRHKRNHVRRALALPDACSVLTY